MKVKEILREMAKRASPDQFYTFAKKLYGADKVKSLTWPEIVKVAKDHDVLIPAYLRSQKVGRGRFNVVPAEHPDAKAPAKVEFKPLKKPESPREIARQADEPKAPKVEPKPAKKEYAHPQFSSYSYSDWREFMDAIKKEYGDVDITRVEHGTQRSGRHGVQLGSVYIVDKKTDKVVGEWETTGADMIPGRGFTTYGYGRVAKAGAPKKEEPKSAPKEPKSGVSLAEIKKQFPELGKETYGDELMWQVTERGGKISVSWEHVFKRNTRLGAYHDNKRRIIAANDRIDRLAEKYKDSLIDKHLVTAETAKKSDDRSESNGDSAYSEYEQSLSGGLTLKAE